MIHDLDLKRVSLLAFGLIYSCTQNGDGCWYGGFSMLAVRTGATNRSITNAVNKLEKLGYIERFDVKIKGLKRTGLRSIIDWDEKESKIIETSNNEEYNSEKHRFISKFLDPDRKRTIKQVYSFIDRYIVKRKPVPDGVVDYIKSMPYKRFMSTLYWQAVSTHIKDRAGNRCQICGIRANLATHHNTYEHHGDEIHNLSDMICVCDDCHRKIHNK